MRRRLQLRLLRRWPNNQSNPVCASKTPPNREAFFVRMLSMSSDQEGESPSPSLIEAKGSEAQGRDREVPSESSVEQTCGLTNRNRMRGTKGGRAGVWPRSPFRSTPGSVDAVAVQGRWDDLSQEVCRATRRKSRLSPPRGRLTGRQKSAQGIVARKTGKAGWSEGPDGVPKWAQVRSGRVNCVLP